MSLFSGFEVEFCMGFATFLFLKSLRLYIITAALWTTHVNSLLLLHVEMQGDRLTFKESLVAVCIV